MSIENSRPLQNPSALTEAEAEPREMTDPGDIDAASYTVFEHIREEVTENTVTIQGDRRRRPAIIPLDFVARGMGMGMSMKDIRKQADQLGISTQQPRTKRSAA